MIEKDMKKDIDTTDVDTMLVKEIMKYLPLDISCEPDGSCTFTFDQLLDLAICPKCQYGHVYGEDGNLVQISNHPEYLLIKFKCAVCGHKYEANKSKLGLNNDIFS